MESIMDQNRENAQDIAVFPAVIRIMPQHVFNMKDPIIMGVEVLDGILKVGAPLCIPSNNFLDIGKVISIESNHKEVSSIRKGNEVAIKVQCDWNPSMTYGRQFDHTHKIYTKISRKSINALKEHFKSQMTNPDWALVVNMKKIYGIQ